MNALFRFLLTYFCVIHITPHASIDVVFYGSTPRLCMLLLIPMLLLLLPTHTGL